MTHTTNTPPQPPTIKTLTTQLEETLTAPHPSGDILGEQAQILNQLFTTLMATKITDRLENPRNYHLDATMEWLSMTLKIQKQCTDTVKTKGAMDYMNALNGRITHPHPAKIEKQTSETE